MAGALAGLRAAANAAEKNRQEESDREEQSFSKRVRIQQFLNQIGPLFRVFAGGKMPVTDLVEGSALRDYAEKVRRLSIAVACAVQDTAPEAADPVMVRNIVPAIAEFVAKRIEADIPIDIIRDTAAIVAALNASDERYDINPFNGSSIARDMTVKMTVAGAVAGLLTQLAWYDFRSKDLPATASRLKDALTGRVASIVAQVAPEADERDRVSLTQSFLKHYSPLLENALARTSAETLAILKPMTEAQRRDWYAGNDPIGAAIGRFIEVSSALDASVMTKELFDSNPAALAPKSSAPEGP